jgi:hypothetical protein
MNKAWWALGIVVLALGAWWFLRPLSTLAKIQKLVLAPVQKDAVTLKQWQTFETETKVFVPEEFKTFIVIYGCGSVNKTLQVLAPMCLDYKGGLKDQDRLLVDLMQRLISPPTRILLEMPPRKNVPNNLKNPEDIVRRWMNDNWQRQEEFIALLTKMQQAGQLKPTDKGLALLEKVRSFLVQHYRLPDAAFAKQLKEADLSKISLYTADITQHDRNQDYAEIYQEQLAEFLTSKKLEGNRFYLWGSVRGTNYDLGWLGKEDKTGLHLQSDKVFLFSKDDFAVLEMDFAEFILRFLEQDKSLWQRIRFANDLDEAFRAKKYQFIANPHQR